MGQVISSSSVDISCIVVLLEKNVAGEEEKYPNGDVTFDQKPMLMSPNGDTLTKWA